MDAAVTITSLRNRIRANAAFSACSGVFVVVAATWLGDQIGSDRHGLVRAVGVGLIAYAVDLVVVASVRWRRLRVMASWIVVADYAWVAGTIAMLATGSIEGAAGQVLIASAGLAVGALAVGQHGALYRARRLQSALGADADASPPVEAIRIERPSHLDVSRLWTAVEDHELFGRLARNLDRVEVVGGEGTDLVRRCVATNGDEWTEQCTIWEPGRRHAVEVDTSRYPYPLELVACLSYVEADADRGGGSNRAGLVFQVRAKAGLAGQLAVIVLHLGRPVLARIVRGWIETAATRTRVAA